MEQVQDHKCHQLLCTVAEFSVCETEAKSDITVVDVRECQRSVRLLAAGRAKVPASAEKSREQ